MTKFCANLTWLFAELDMMDRFGAAKDAGFDAVEILSPYDLPAQDILRELTRHDLPMALIACPPPNYTGGAPGFAAVAESQGRFQQDFKRTLRFAGALRAQCILIEPGDASGDAAQDALIENLRWAADQAPKQTLTIQPRNTADAPGCFLNDFHKAAEIIRTVDRPNLRLQFDAYHAARIHGDIIAIWQDCHELVAHVQVAQLPHRTEPVDGKIAYSAFFERIAADGYDGWIAAEYGPSGTTMGSLDWMR